MKKRICVLTTGGTIGSKSESCIEICNTQNNVLIDLATEKVGDIAFDLFSVLNLHSENVQEKNLYKIVDAIKNTDTDTYDGIILTHGTDTLSFTANYLSLTLDLPIPVTKRCRWSSAMQRDFESPLAHFVCWTVSPACTCSREVL